MKYDLTDYLLLYMISIYDSYDRIILFYQFFDNKL